MNSIRRYGLPLVLVLAGLLLIGLYALQQRPRSEAAKPPPPTSTPEPVLPTRTPGAQAAQPAAQAPQAEAHSPTAEAAAVAAAAALSQEIPLMERFGTAGAVGHIAPALAAGLPFGSYFNWHVSPEPAALPGGVVYWQTIRTGQDGVRTSWDDIEVAVAANPGAIWIVGNEPDVIWQDDVTAERYAEQYHQAYSFIKARDGSARIAIAGVAQPTPLRMAYLDLVLDSYRARYGEEMPIDVWTVHAYILREEAGSWGVDIPPGMSGELAIQYEIDDHGVMAIFQQNLEAFRAWMAARGYQDRPLAITEYGILMPEDYGFPPQAKAQFLRDSFDYLLSAANETGYPADGSRLVQYWFWFSLYDGNYTAGNLFDVPSGELTPLGQAWAAYVLSLQ